MKTMKIVLTVCLVFLILGIKLMAQTDSINYLDQAPVGNTPQLFPLEVSDGHSAIERVAFSADGHEIYYAEMNINASYSTFSSTRIKYYQFLDGQWSGPFVLFENCFSPFITAGGDTMFVNRIDPMEIAFSVKTESGWSALETFFSDDNIIGGGRFEGHLQTTNRGKYYITSSIAHNGQGGVDVCKIMQTEDSTYVESFEKPLNNTTNNNYLLMAEDESYAITYTLAGGDHMEGRALISYPKNDGSWTNPKSMGFGGWGVTISPDKKYLFHSSYDGARFDTYWVRVDSLIEALKTTNFLPYVNKKIEDAEYGIGESYQLPLPDSLFVDDDGNNTLTISAQLGSDPLPDWLNFDPETRTFTGILSEAGSFNIKIIATDNEEATANTRFRLNVIDGTSNINQSTAQNIKIFPNPTHGIVNIALNDAAHKSFKLEIVNLKGEKLLSNTYDAFNFKGIDLSALPKGIYFLNILINEKRTTKKLLIN